MLSLMRCRWHVHAFDLMLLLAGCGHASSRVVASPVQTVATPRVLTEQRGAEIGSATTPEPATPLPADVIAFRERRDACDHFRGEEPYDAERAAFLSDALTQNCTGTDAELKALRLRYAKDAAARAALAAYEDAIE